MWGPMANFKPKLSTDEWTMRLSAEFSHDGRLGGKMVAVEQSEALAVPQAVLRVPRQVALSSAFMGFFVETLELVEARIRTLGWSHDAQYAVAWAYFANIFRRLRSADVLFVNGYPLEGYSLLRDVKDRAFLLAGIAHNMATFETIAIGTKPIDHTRPDFGRLTTEGRKKIERQITQRLRGQSSGLGSDVQEDLLSWDQMFHLEVHGGLLGFSLETIGLVRSGIPPSIGPRFDDEALSTFVNRSAEINWLLVRLMPYLQMSDRDFGMSWARRRLLLDDFFRMMVEELGLLGKRVGDSFITMVDRMFVFKEPFHYFEADGTG